MGYDSKAFVVYTRYPLLANRRNDNKKTRKPVNTNIGMIIFMVILIYVMYSIFRYDK